MPDDVHFRFKAMIAKHPRDGQAVTAIVAHPADYPDQGRFLSLFRNPPEAGTGSPFHEVERTYRLMVDGVKISLPDHLNRQYFQCTHNPYLSVFQTSL
jgi:hypothetical protein